MIRTLAAAALLGAVAFAPAAFADQAKFNTETTLLSEIWANPEAKAAFAKIFPEVAANDQIEQGMGMSLTEISGYVPDMMTPEKLKELQAEFDKIQTAG